MTHSRPSIVSRKIIFDLTGKTSAVPAWQISRTPHRPWFERSAPVLWGWAADSVPGGPAPGWGGRQRRHSPPPRRQAGPCQPAMNHPLPAAPRAHYRMSPRIHYLPTPLPGVFLSRSGPHPRGGSASQHLFSPASSSQPFFRPCLLPRFAKLPQLYFSIFCLPFFAPFGPPGGGVQPTQPFFQPGPFSSWPGCGTPTPRCPPHLCPTTPYV